MNQRHDYKIERAWFQLDGIPYPVRGYYDRRDDWNGFACPAFERDEAELIIDWVNRGFPIPAYEWDEHGNIKATAAGIEEGYEDYPVNKSVANLNLYWIGAWGWCWTVFDVEPNEDEWNLEFESREEPQLIAYGSGETLIQALAKLERDLIAQTSLDAAFHKHFCFLNRDITSIDEDLSAIGGVFSCYDFSAPEDAFTIRRIPINPEAKEPDGLDVAMKRLEQSVSDLAATLDYSSLKKNAIA